MYHKAWKHHFVWAPITPYTACKRTLGTNTKCTIQLGNSLLCPHAKHDIRTANAFWVDTENIPYCEETAFCVRTQNTPYDLQTQFGCAHKMYHTASKRPFGWPYLPVRRFVPCNALVGCHILLFLYFSPLNVLLCIYFSPVLTACFLTRLLCIPCAAYRCSQ